MNGRAAAVEAAGRGCAVFPCRPGDKRPAVPDWERRACADPELVARYWPSVRHNVGIARGPSGLTVVDLDPPDGRGRTSRRSAMSCPSRSPSAPPARAACTCTSPRRPGW